jgi:hypothetical protein
MTNRATATLDTSQVEGTWIGVVLSGIDVLDQWGAAEWSSRYVAIGSAIILGVILVTFKKKLGVEWYSLIHPKP